MLASPLFCWPASISIRLSLSPALLVTFPFVCLPCLVAALFRCFYSFVPHALLVSALFRWPCGISIHLSPRLVTGGVRPLSLFLFICLPGLSLLVSALFPLAMQHFYSFVSQVCHCWCPPFFAGHAAFLFISQVCHCWCPPLSVGHAAFLFMCLPCLSLVVSALSCIVKTTNQVLEVS